MKKVWLILVILCSCESKYSETMHYVSYYDQEKTQKYVEGVLYNKEESGEWTFYSESGDTIENGNYSEGLQDGLWNYKLPNVDSSINWMIIERGKLNFSLPNTFKLYPKMTDSFNTTYLDSVTHTLLGISVINCDSICFQNYYNTNLAEFKDRNMNVLFSQSQIVKSKSGVFYLDEYSFTRGDYPDTIKQYMTYRRVGHQKILVITITNKEEYGSHIKFLIGEVFYHFKYNYHRIAFPYEEIIVNNNSDKDDEWWWD